VWLSMFLHYSWGVKKSPKTAYLSKKDEKP
jgi:hypothetical protein